MTTAFDQQVRIYSTLIKFIVETAESACMNRTAVLAHISAGLEDALQKAAPADDLALLCTAVRLACERAGLSDEETRQVVPSIN